ncbi:MAG: purine-nucleoside phosphorylase [Planctomycetota bacterium]
MRERVDRATDFLVERGFDGAEIGIVLGSGLGPLADAVEIEREVANREIPDFPESTVKGHEGRFIVGRLGGRRVLVLKGRLHGYEGYDLALTALPIRIMARLGIHTLVITNGAGGIDLDFRPGDVMLIEDHLNLQGRSPLTGPNVEEWGPRFPDMTAVYDADLRRLALEVARARGIALRRGIYASVPGPQYETPAEIRMLRSLGAQAVGMSSVPEAIVARHMGVRVLGLSVITNAAAGVTGATLNHDEVVAAGQAAGEEVSGLVAEIVSRMEAPAR